MANSPVAPDAPAAAGANSAVLSGSVGTGAGLGLGAPTSDEGTAVFADVTIGSHVNR